MIHDKRDFHDLFFRLFFLLFPFQIFLDTAFGKLPVAIVIFTEVIAEIWLALSRPIFTVYVCISCIIVVVTTLPLSKNVILILLLFLKSWDGAI